MVLARTLQHIEYAKTKSYATLKKEDPEFVPPTSIHARDTAARLGNEVFANGEKRPRDGRVDEDERRTKRERTEESDDDAGEEMEIEDDEDTGAKTKNGKLHLPVFRHCALISSAMLLRQAPFLRQ